MEACTMCVCVCVCVCVRVCVRVRVCVCVLFGFIYLYILQFLCIQNVPQCLSDHLLLGEIWLKTLKYSNGRQQFSFIP